MSKKTAAPTASAATEDSRVFELVQRTDDGKRNSAVSLNFDEYKHAGSFIRGLQEHYTRGVETPFGRFLHSLVWEIDPKEATPEMLEDLVEAFRSDFENDVETAVEVATRYPRVFTAAKAARESAETLKAAGEIEESARFMLREAAKIREEAAAESDAAAV